MIFILEKTRIFGTIKSIYLQKPDKIVEYLKKNNGDLNFFHILYQILYGIRFNFIRIIILIHIRFHAYRTF